MTGYRSANKSAHDKPWVCPKWAISLLQICCKSAHDEPLVCPQWETSLPTSLPMMSYESSHNKPCTSLLPVCPSWAISLPTMGNKSANKSTQDEPLVCPQPTMYESPTSLPMMSHEYVHNGPWVCQEVCLPIFPWWAMSLPTMPVHNGSCVCQEVSTQICLWQTMSLPTTGCEFVHHGTWSHGSDYDGPWVCPWWATTLWVLMTCPHVCT